MAETKGTEQAENEVKKEEEVTEYTDPSSVVYRVGDTVYIESQRSDMPYFICTIRNFNRNKKDHISVDVVWLYRPCEIPTSVYELLSQDRHMEYGSNILDDPFVKSRELFISDAVDVYPVSALRGHACCVPFSEIKDNVLEYLCKENNWFYILGYNPESRRMANAKGEIRIGVSHQACPPVCNTNRESKEAIADLESTCKEELLWKPTLPKSKLMVYLRAARSILSFSGYCETEDGCPEKALNALSEDQNTAHSYNVLHKNNYDISVALRELIRNPTPKIINKPWTDDDRKRFMQGLRSYGKTFHKIQKEFLPERKTSELVTYYYIWKKTSVAVNSRPHKRGGRRNILARRTRTTKPKTAETSEFLDLSSCSENDVGDTDNSENANDLSLYACRHCYATKSPNWHHGGKNKILLCYACRMYFKHYGHMRPLSQKEKREPPPFIFKAAFENLDDGIQYSGRMRTRRSSTPVFTNANSVRSRLVQEGKVSNRRQVTVPSNVENLSDKEDKEESEVEVNVLKRSEDDDEIEQLQEAVKQRKSETTDAEDADDESEDDNTTVRLANCASTEDSIVAEESSNSEVHDTEKSCPTVFTSSIVTTSSSIVSSVSVKQEAVSPTPAPGTFMPIKQEEEEEEEEVAEEEMANNEGECEQGSPDSSPDVSDDEKLIQKIKERFAHNETEVGNSCSRCEMYYIHKRPKKQRPNELDTSKRREEYVQRKDSNQKRHVNGTPPSTHQPAQITSHYETMRLLAAQVARTVEPKHYWPSGYQVPHEMHGHRPTSPREFIGDPSRKYVHLLEALDSRPRVELRSPRSATGPGHPPHASHNYPPRPVDNNREFRINPANHPHHPPHHPPVSLDNMSRIPLPTSMESMDSGPSIDRQRIDPLTGLPTIQPHLHSHHHTHTHLHVHPDDLKYNRHCAPPQPEPSHFERHERAQPLHQQPHPPQLSATSLRPNSYSREYYEHLSKYPDLLAQMQHDPRLRESLAHHPLAAGGRGGDGRRENMLLPPRDGAVSPSIPHDIPSAPSDPVAYHLWVTKYANMQQWKSHGGGQSHAQAPELSPHGIPQQPLLPHDIRNEHEKHMKEKMYAHTEREQLAYAEHIRTLEHENHLRSMLQNQEHADSVKLALDHNMPSEHHSFKRGDVHKSYHSNNPFIDPMRRTHDTHVQGHERNFHDSLRFGHERLERDRAVHQERALHMERYPDRGRHERPSIFGNYKPPETIDLSEE